MAAGVKGVYKWRVTLDSQDSHTLSYRECANLAMRTYPLKCRYRMSLMFHGVSKGSCQIKVEEKIISNPFFQKSEKQ